MLWPGFSSSFAESDVGLFAASSRSCCAFCQVIKVMIFSFFRMCRSFCQVIKVGEFCTDGTVMEAPGGNGINQLWQANGRQVGKFGSLVLQIDSIEDDGTDNRHRRFDVLDFLF